jgi:hypothetical protein
MTPTERIVLFVIRVRSKFNSLTTSIADTRAIAMAAATPTQVTTIVNDRVSVLTNGASSAFDTFLEFQNALAADESQIATMSTAIGTRASQVQVDGIMAQLAEIANTDFVALLEQGLA